MTTQARSGVTHAGFRSSDAFVYILIVCVMAVWAGVIVVGKLAVAMVPPFSLSALRFILMTACLFVLLRRSGQQPASIGRGDVGAFTILGFLGVYGFFILFLLGVTFAPGTDGALFLGLNPIATSALAALFIKEKMTWHRVAALVTSFAGVVLVVSSQGGGAYKETRLLGDLAFFGALVCWSLYSVYGKVVMRRFSPLAATTYSTLLGTALLIPFAIAEGAGTQLREAIVAPQFWGLLLYLSLIGGVLGFSWWNTGIQRIGPGRTASFYNLMPIFGIGFSWALLGEEVGAVHLAGAALVIAGIWLATRPVAMQT